MGNTQSTKPRQRDGHYPRDSHVESNPEKRPRPVFLENRVIGILKKHPDAPDIPIPERHSVDPFSHEAVRVGENRYEMGVTKDGRIYPKAGRWGSEKVRQLVSSREIGTSRRTDAEIRKENKQVIAQVQRYNAGYDIPTDATCKTVRQLARAICENEPTNLHESATPGQLYRSAAFESTKWLDRKVADGLGWDRASDDEIAKSTADFLATRQSLRNAWHKSFGDGQNQPGGYNYESD